MADGSTITVLPWNYDAIANIDAFDLILRFEGKTVTIDAKERTYESGMKLTGMMVGSAPE